MDIIRTQWRDLARRYIATKQQDRRVIWPEVDEGAPHLPEGDRTATFYALVAAVKHGDVEAEAIATARLTGAVLL